MVGSDSVAEHGCAGVRRFGRLHGALVIMVDLGISHIGSFAKCVQEVLCT